MGKILLSKFNFFTCSPIDWWEQDGWLKLADAIQAMDMNTSSANDLLAKVIEASYILKTKESYWEGDVSEGPYLRLCQLGLSIAWKQQNNGQTFILVFGDTTVDPKDVDLFCRCEGAERVFEDEYCNIGF